MSDYLFPEQVAALTDDELNREYSRFYDLATIRYREMRWYEQTNPLNCAGDTFRNLHSAWMRPSSTKDRLYREIIRRKGY